MTKEHAKNEQKKLRSKRSVALYVTILFCVAALFLVLAYFMQERAYAYTATQLLLM